MAKDIEATERALAENLSRLSRLRSQQKLLRDRGAEMFNRGMERLDAEEDPPSPAPMSSFQEAVGQVQQAGGFGVLDWEAMGIPSADPLAWAQEYVA